jgi:hypothetical protein
LVRATGAVAWAVLFGLTGGCDDAGVTIAQLRQRNRPLEAQLGQLERDHVSLREELKKRKAQIAGLLRLGVRRLDLLA